MGANVLKYNFEYDWRFELSDKKPITILEKVIVMINIVIAVSPKIVPDLLKLSSVNAMQQSMIGGS